MDMRRVICIDINPFTILSGVGRSFKQNVFFDKCFILIVNFYASPAIQFAKNLFIGIPRVLCNFVG